MKKKEKTCRCVSSGLISDFLAEIFQARRVAWNFPSTEGVGGGIGPPRALCPVKLSFRNKEERNTFPEKQKRENVSPPELSYKKF